MEVNTRNIFGLMIYTVYIRYAATVIILPEQNSYVSVLECVLDITDKYSGRRTFIFLSEEIENNQFAETLILNLSGVKEIVSPQNLTNQEGFFIFIARKNRYYSKILESITSVDNSRFLLIWLQPESNLLQVRSVFEEFWKFEFLDVIALVEMKYGGLSIYTYFPFTNTRCSDSGPPVLIDTWSHRNSMFTRQKKLYDRYEKIYNLYGCPIQCSGSNRPPDSIIEQLTNTTYNYSGSAGLLFKFITLHMNFTPIINRVSDTTLNNEGNFVNESSVIANDVASRRVDIGFGMFSRLLDLHSKISFVKETNMDCFTWAVPTGAADGPSMWSTYVGEFSWVIWLLICIYIIIAYFVLRFISNYAKNENAQFKNLVNLGFFVYNSFIGAPINELPRTTSFRSFVAAWLYYSLVLSAAYQASLGSFATVPASIANIEDTTQLSRTKFSITGSPQMFYILNSSSDTSYAIRTLLKRFEVLPPGYILPNIERIVVQRDVAVFAAKGLLSFFNNKLRSNNLSVTYLQSQCVIKSPASPLIVRRVSPLLEPLSVIVGRLFEAGMLIRWESISKPVEMNANGLITPKLYLKQMQGAFTFLITGLIVSFIVFIAELIYYHIFYPPPDLLTQLKAQGYKTPFIS
uniref:Uncharacterized protein n=1 Tax=Clastoptera arizonana TaxID=38151 RepID=A0A1B6ECL1_9HEMI